MAAASITPPVAEVVIRYNDALHWMSHQAALNKMRHSVASTRADFFFFFLQHDVSEDWEHISEQDQKRFKEDHRDFWTKLKPLFNKRTIRYTPASDQYHWFIYENCFFFLYRRSYKNISTLWAARMENFHLYAWRRTSMDKLLQAIREQSTCDDCTVIK